MKVYPNVAVVSSAKAFVMMENFFGADFCDNRIVVGEGDTLSLGKHTLTFVSAPMVHWPEVMVTYDACDRVLFSADGFGKFGALDRDEPWDDEARRYYIGIVGKYGAQVQALLKKAATLDIAAICPLHGPVLKENLGHYIGLYDTWSSYSVESEGICVAYTSVYGNTKRAVELLVEKLRENACPKIAVYDLARDDMSEAVASAFRYGKLVLATTTYNAELFPFMQRFIDSLTERGFKTAPLRSSKTVHGLLLPRRSCARNSNPAKIYLLPRIPSRSAPPSTRKAETPSARLPRNSAATISRVPATEPTRTI